MATQQFQSLLRKAYTEGLTGEEEFQLELEAAANPEAKAMLEQAERDDWIIHQLRDEIGPGGEVSWYQSRLLSMAASAVLAIGATLLVTQTLETVDVSTGLASSNVVYLETLRSGDISGLPTVNVGGPNDWITLVAYPAYDDFAEFRIRVERLAGGEAQLNDPDSATWTIVWESQAGTGNRDSLVINLKSELLSVGTYRLHVEGRVASSDNYLPAAQLPFRIAD
jgi:hypothetical protein